MAFSSLDPNVAGCHDSHQSREGLWKVKICEHWLQARCNFGRNPRACLFAHGLNDLNMPDEAYRKDWSQAWSDGEVDISCWVGYKRSAQSMRRFQQAFLWEHRYAVNEIPNWAWADAIRAGIVQRFPPWVPDDFGIESLKAAYKAGKAWGAKHGCRSSVRMELDRQMAAAREARIRLLAIKPPPGFEAKESKASASTPDEQAAPEPMEAAPGASPEPKATPVAQVPIPMLGQAKAEEEAAQPNEPEEAQPPPAPVPDPAPVPAEPDELVVLQPKEGETDKQAKEVEQQQAQEQEEVEAGPTDAKPKESKADTSPEPKDNEQAQAKAPPRAQASGVQVRRIAQP